MATEGRAFVSAGNKLTGLSVASKLNTAGDNYVSAIIAARMRATMSRHHETNGPFSLILHRRA